jgi:hypothetical protein
VSIQVQSHGPHLLLLIYTQLEIYNIYISGPVIRGIIFKNFALKKINKEMRKYAGRSFCCVMWVKLQRDSKKKGETEKFVMKRRRCGIRRRG